MAAVLEDSELAKAVRLDYEAGILSLREIAKAHSTDGRSFSHVTLKNFAEASGWSRNLQPKIHAKATEKVHRAIAREQDPKLDAATEREVIEANAERIAQVRGEHRHNINRARKLVLKLFGELEGAESLLELDRTLKVAIDSLRSVVDMEREAYGMAKGAAEPPPTGGDDDPVDLKELARGVAFMLTRAVIQKAKDTA
jgi:hypothetical protein